MSEPFSEKLNRAWYGKRLWTYWLLPLSLLYLLVVRLRRAIYTSAIKGGSASAKKQNAPVVVVGNITVGGTGKSPLVAYLVRGFREKGYRVGIVSRGYGAKIEKDEVRMVTNCSSPSEVGDEPLMLYRALGCEIALSPTRKLAVAKLEELGCELIISDDGLQHYAMARDIELCVIDAQRGLGNGWVLPVGPLREPASRLQSIDFLIRNGGREDATSLQCAGQSFDMLLVPTDFENVETGEILPIADFVSKYANADATAIAAIGNPQRFFHALAELGIQVGSCNAYPDHHAFERNDFADLTRLILMTEKDAVKCRGLGLSNAWFLRVHPQFQDNLIETIYNRLVANGRLTRQTQSLN